MYVEFFSTALVTGYTHTHARAVCKVRGLTLLSLFGTFWRCGDGLFLEYLPWQTMHFLQRSTRFSKTCCRPFITSKFLASELPFHSWKIPESHGARSWLYGGYSNGVPPIHFFQTEHRIQFKSHPMRFLGFSNHEKWVPRQILKWSTVCSMFPRSGWSVVRSASFAKGGTLKKTVTRTFTMFRLGLVSPRTLQTILIYILAYVPLVTFCPRATRLEPYCNWTSNFMKQSPYEVSHTI
jgi:hypothetical protein